MTTREQLTAEKIDALIRLIADDGASPAGTIPDVEYLNELRAVGELRQGNEVAEAHRERRGPPDIRGQGQGGN